MPLLGLVIPNLFRNLATGEISPWSACDLGIITVWRWLDAEIDEIIRVVSKAWFCHNLRAGFATLSRRPSENFDSAWQIMLFGFCNCLAVAELKVDPSPVSRGVLDGYVFQLDGGQILNKIICLGFTPRSQSFAVMPCRHSQLNLFAIRTHFVPSVRKSA